MTMSDAFRERWEDDYRRRRAAELEDGTCFNHPDRPGVRESQGHWWCGDCVLMRRLT